MNNERLLSVNSLFTSNKIKMAMIDSLKVRTSKTHNHDFWDLKNQVPKKYASKRKWVPNSKRPYHDVAKLKEMNWKQAKKAFPRLNPNGDLDYDGTINSKDCKVFDPARDGKFSDFLKGVKEKFIGKKSYQGPVQEGISEKTFRRTGKSKKTFKQKYKETRGAVKSVTGPYERTLKTLEKTTRPVRSGISQEYRTQAKVLRRVTGSRPVGSVVGKKGEKKYAKAGRPKGEVSYKYSIGGKKVPATVYHKWAREMRQAARERAEQVQIIRQAQLAKRGVVLQQQAPQQQIQQPQQVQQVYQQPQPQQVQRTPEEEQAMQEKMARLRAIKEMQYQQQAPPQQVQQVQPQQMQYQQQAPPQVQQVQPQQQMRPQAEGVPHYSANPYARPNTVQRIVKSILGGQRVQTLPATERPWRN